MVLRSDDLLDQLDSRLSMMQAQLPSNPDTRRLPSGWVEHLDPQYVLSSSSLDVVLTTSVALVLPLVENFGELQSLNPRHVVLSIMCHIGTISTSVLPNHAQHLSIQLTN